MANNLLTRVFGIEKQEVYAVAWSFLYFSCVLSSYMMLRPIRETMGVESGTDTVPLLFSTTFVVMLLVAPVFGWVASRFPRRRFLPWVYIFFALNILAFYAAFTIADLKGIHFVWIGRVFFVWISVFNLFVVSVFWSFMADIWSKEQGRRLFGLISAGGSIGGTLGPLVTAQLAEPLGFQNVLPISAGLLLVSVVCIHRLRHWLETRPDQEVMSDAATAKPLGGSAIAGMSHVLSSRYLLMISIVSIIASLLGTALYMFVNELVSTTIEGTDSRARLFGYVDSATNLLTTMLQLFVTRHAVRKFGLGWTLAFMPLVSVIGFALLAVHPALLVGVAFQTVRRAVGFGFSKPGSDMLFSAVTPEEKYKAKNFIDTAVYRGGDLVGIWVVQALRVLGISVMSVILVPFALLWVFIVLWLGREYRKRDHSGQLKTKGAARA